MAGIDWQLPMQRTELNNSRKTSNPIPTSTPIIKPSHFWFFIISFIEESEYINLALKNQYIYKTSI